MSTPTPSDVLVKQLKEENPSSHIFKIENFSLLKKYEIKQVESSVFNISGHKWKLILYPEGNEEDEGNGYVSLYLKYEDLGQIKATYQLFVYNQKKRTKLSQQGIANFDKTNNKGSASKLITLANLKDSDKDYLVGDCSIFGVKLSGSSITNGPATAESFSLIEKPQNNKVTWKMEKYLAFNQEKNHYSNEFVIGNTKWRLRIFPRGDSRAKGEYVSAFLYTKGFVENTPETNTFATFTLRILNQKDEPHHEYTCPYAFLETGKGSGWSQFMPLGDLNKGFLVNNKLLLGVEIEAVSVAKYC